MKLGEDMFHALDEGGPPDLPVVPAVHDPQLGRQADDTAQLAEAGGTLLLRLSALLRTARTYDVSNMAFQRQLQEFMGVLRRLLDEEEEVTLVAWPTTST